MASSPAAWLNGAVVPWEECVVHARSQGAIWGANVFEGIRAYWRPDEGRMYAFRLADHLERLVRSMKALHMRIDWTPQHLAEACSDLVRAGGFTEHLHLCIVAYFDMHPSFDPMHHTDATGVHITAVPVPRPEQWSRGAAVGVSSWRRLSDDTMPPRIKTGANYGNSRLAMHEAARNGYDNALLLNQRGSVAEAPGACVAMIRDGRMVTPPGTAGVLEGITLDSVLTLAGTDLGLTVEKREIDRTELYAADEAFLCGTMAEIMPIVSLDRIPIGDGTPGPLTRALQKSFDQALAGPWSTPL